MCKHNLFLENLFSSIYQYITATFSQFSWITRPREKKNPQVTRKAKHNTKGNKSDAFCWMIFFGDTKM